MSLFDLFKGEDADAKAQREARETKQAASRQRIEAGSIPLEAVERLGHNASRQNTPQHLWTSDLSVSELLLVEQSGFEPLGQVMGTSVYHVGIQWTSGAWRNSAWSSGTSYEFDVLTRAFYNARHLALSRLAEEAALLGATAVVGVRLTRVSVGWAADLLEFSAIGTAIREKDVRPASTSGAANTSGGPYAALPPGFRAGVGPGGTTSHSANVQPPTLCLSDLSGQEFWKLRAAGFRPVGIATGNCTYYTIPSWGTQNVTAGGFFGMGSWQNVELPDYTQSLYTARELAMSRMEHEAATVGGTGIVGVTMEVEAEPREIEINNRTRLDMLFHFTTIGTVIAPMAAPPTRPQVALTVSLLRGAASDDIEL